MRPKTVEGFIFFPLGRLLEFWCDPSGLHVTPSTQVSKEGVRHSGVYKNNDVPYSLKCVLFILF